LKVSFDVPESDASKDDTHICDVIQEMEGDQSDAYASDSHYRDPVNEEIHRELRGKTKHLPTAPLESSPRRITRSISRQIRPLLTIKDREPTVPLNHLNNHEIEH